MEGARSPFAFQQLASAGTAQSLLVLDRAPGMLIENISYQSDPACLALSLLVHLLLHFCLCCSAFAFSQTELRDTVGIMMAFEALASCVLTARHSNQGAAELLRYQQPPVRREVSTAQG